MRDLTAACVQTPPGGVATPEYVDAVLAGAPEPVDLAVLPELCTTLYFPLEPDSPEAASASAIDGPELAAFGDVARRRGCVLVLGVYLSDGGRRFNSAVVFGPDGEIMAGRASDGSEHRSYHKVHLCDVQLAESSFCETAYFDAGDRYLVWDMPFGCMGVLICYDRHFPEAWVALRELGADITAVCTTSGMHMEHSFVAEMQGMSLQMSEYVVQANRVGVEVLPGTGRRSEFLGGSCITGPFGEVLAAAPLSADQPLVHARLSADHLRDVRRAHQFHEHRRPETYVAAANPQETTA